MADVEWLVSFGGRSLIRIDIIIVIHFTGCPGRVFFNNLTILLRRCTYGSRDKNKNGKNCLFHNDITSGAVKLTRRKLKNKISLLLIFIFESMGENDYLCSS
jgi:hypothetical protein